MIQRQWRVPCELVEIVEDIRIRVEYIKARITHIFREGKSVADYLANEVIETQLVMQYLSFQDLSTRIRSALNMDKAQVPNLRIRTRNIKPHISNDE